MIGHYEWHETTPSLFVWIPLASQDNVEPLPSFYQSSCLGKVIVSIVVCVVVHLWARSSITFVSLTSYVETRIPLHLLCSPLWINENVKPFLPLIIQSKWVTSKFSILSIPSQPRWFKFSFSTQKTIYHPLCLLILTMPMHWTFPFPLFSCVFDNVKPFPYEIRSFSWLNYPLQKEHTIGNHFKLSNFPFSITKSNSSFLFRFPPLLTWTNLGTLTKNLFPS